MRPAPEIGETLKAYRERLAVFECRQTLRRLLNKDELFESEMVELEEAAARVAFAGALDRSRRERAQSITKKRAARAAPVVMQERSENEWAMLAYDSGRLRHAQRSNDHHRHGRDYVGHGDSCGMPVRLWIDVDLDALEARNDEE